MKLALVVAMVAGMVGCRQRSPNCADVQAFNVNACAELLVGHSSDGKLAFIYWDARLQPLQECFVDLDAKAVGPCLPIPKELQ